MFGYLSNARGEWYWIIKWNVSLYPQRELVFWYFRPWAVVKLTLEDCVRATEEITVGCVELSVLQSVTHKDTGWFSKVKDFHRWPESSCYVNLTAFAVALCLRQSFASSHYLPTRVECARFTSSLETTQTNSNVSMSLRVRRADGDKGRGHHGPRNRQMGAQEKAKAG